MKRCLETVKNVIDQIIPKIKFVPFIETQFTKFVLLIEGQSDLQRKPQFTEQNSNARHAYLINRL